VEAAQVKKKIMDIGNSLRSDDLFVLLDSAHIQSAAGRNKYKWICGLEGESIESSWKEMRHISASRMGDWSIFLLPYDCIYEMQEHDSAPQSWVPFTKPVHYFPEVILAETWEGEMRYWPDEEKAMDCVNSYPLEKRIIKATDLSVQFNTSEADYKLMVEQIKRDIVAGAYYEANYTIEGRVEGIFNHPFKKFESLSSISPAPFSAFFQNPDRFLISSSPERFLGKYGTKLFTQPIKGTAPRFSDTDMVGFDYLVNSEKERAEHVMIVDLVRNDLTKVCEPGTIKVPELMKIYAYTHIFQMVSTVEGQVSESADFLDLMNACFPMGSMTGAPKLEVIKTMNAYEDQSRGLYSGTIGYIDPDGDLDSSVIIRSLIGDKQQKRMAINVGGAITYDSDPDKEYEECMLKAQKMIEVLSK
jgi:para-aminobenzoate synthetase component 1